MCRNSMFPAWECCILLSSLYGNKLSADVQEHKGRVGVIRCEVATPTANVSCGRPIDCVRLKARDWIQLDRATL